MDAQEKVQVTAAASWPSSAQDLWSKVNFVNFVLEVRDHVFISIFDLHLVAEHCRLRVCPFNQLALAKA
jgi:hypothetical protein